MRITGLFATYLYKSLKTLRATAVSCHSQSGRFPKHKCGMAVRFSMASPPRGAGIGVALLPEATRPAQAAAMLYSDFGGVVNGCDSASFAAIESASSFGIDMKCTVKNLPES